MKMLSQAAEDELMLLENVFPGELRVDRSQDRTCSAVVTVDVRPATCDDSEKQLVCITARFKLSRGYPEDAAYCELVRPRGLADDDVALLTGRINSILTANVGQAMLYEAIEVIREVLTNSNVPHGPCPICLEDFDSESAIAKTDCYHHLHIRCLANYINCWLDSSDASSLSVDGAEAAAAAPGPSGAASRDRAAAAASAGLEASGGTNPQEYPCPVCRLPSSMDITNSAAWVAVTAAVPPWPTGNDGIVADGCTYRPTPAELEERERRRALYEMQRRKGGIIDVEADRARLHLPPPSRSLAAAATGGSGTSRQPAAAAATGAAAAAAVASEPAPAFQASSGGAQLVSCNSAVVDRRTVGNLPLSVLLPNGAESNRTDGRSAGDV